MTVTRDTRPLALLVPPAYPLPMTHPHTVPPDVETPLERAERQLADLRRLLAVTEERLATTKGHAQDARWDLVLARNQIQRLRRELDALTDGRTWTLAAELVRDVVFELLDDPRVTRRQMRHELQDVVDVVRRRGI